MSLSCLTALWLLRRTRLLKRLKLLIVARVAESHLLNVVLLCCRRDRTSRNHFHQDVQRLEYTLSVLACRTEHRKNFFQVLDDRPQPLETGSLVTPVWCRACSRSLPKRRLVGLSAARDSGRGRFRHRSGILRLTGACRAACDEPCDSPSSHWAACSCDERHIRRCSD